MRRIPVVAYAADPLTQAGMESLLRPRPELEVLEDTVAACAHVALVITEEVDDSAAKVARAIHRDGCPKVLFVVTRLDDAGVRLGVASGGAGFVRRCEATPECLVTAIRSVESGEGCVPPDLLGRLLDQFSHLHDHVLAPRGLNLSGLAEREVDVLRLVADGFDTAEIAKTLAYSERTVKGVIHDVTTRLGLRNRCHAVAYAVRRGLI